MTNNYSRAEVEAMIATVPHWYHRIELYPGLFTPGINDTARYMEMCEFPSRCDGLRVLDLGTRDGFYAFEFERRGAEVVAIDYFPADQTGFSVAARALASKVRHVQDNIYSVTPEKYGSFDIVLCLGLIYHLPDPMLALNLCRKVCRDRFYLETQVIDRAFLTSNGRFQLLKDVNPQLLGVPIMQFYPRNALNNDFTNYWAPNQCCMSRMLEENLFQVNSVKESGARAVFDCKVGRDSDLEYHNQVSRGVVGEGFGGTGSR